MPHHLPGPETGLKPVNNDALDGLGVTSHDLKKQGVYGTLVVATQDTAVEPRYGAKSLTVLVPSDCTIELVAPTPTNFGGRGHNQFIRMAATTAEVAAAFANVPELPPIAPLLGAESGFGR